ncbi:hypothetical protein LJB42_002062 [Komagataella kurtzmanii]|nr:hypothetical protein LJB42_002062 [Komagataella kurtzmanii]
MLYLVCLVNLDIPERDEFYSSYIDSNPYDQLMFVRVDDEQEIKLHLCNWEAPYGGSKRLAFCKKEKTDDGLEFIGVHISDLEMGNTDDDSLMTTIDMPEYDRFGEIFRVYNQKEENKVRFTYVDYVTADDESDAYIKLIR